MAEIELNVLTGQCLNRRIDDIEVVRNEVLAWQEFRILKSRVVSSHKRSPEFPSKLTKKLSTE